MAPLAELVIGQLDLEMMRRVTLLASNRGVEGMVCGGNLMATAATACNQLFLPASGMRIVAGQTGGASDAFGMIGVNVPVALGAGGGRAAAHVVRRVATRAHGVRGHDRGGQHDDIGMASAARHGALRLERVRLMTIHTLRVAAGEQRGFRNSRLRPAVALSTRGQRIRGRRVLVRVTRRAHAVR
jgi:hypothetical protein